MTLDQFRAGLEGRFDPAKERPFVCEGSPLECRAFIVGSHPATMLDSGFWRFWDDGYGFRKADWLKVYTEERRGRGKVLSSTRRIIEHIVDAAQPVRCLETNVYPHPAPVTAELPADQRYTDPFDFLLHAIKPAAVLAFGKEAETHLGRLFGAPLAKELFTPVRAPWGGEVRVRAVRHLARGWSLERAKELGRELREAAG